MRRVKDVVTREGNPVGSRLDAVGVELDPVTTDRPCRNVDVRSHSVRHCRDNLWMRSDAGPLVSREFLSAYISGYADGEGCFTVSILAASDARSGVGGEAELLRQPERRSRRGAPRVADPFRVRKHPAGTTPTSCSLSCSKVKG